MKSKPVVMSVSDSTNSAASPQSATSLDASPPARKKFSTALAVAGFVSFAWLAFLLILTLKTANPATLNVEQLLHSDVIISARIVKTEAGMVEVTEVLLTRIPDLVKNSEQIQISQEMPHWKNGEQRLLPIWRRQDGSWGITPAPIKQRPILDYPVDASVMKQFEQLKPTLTTKPGQR